MGPTHPVRRSQEMPHLARHAPFGKTRASFGKEAHIGPTHARLRPDRDPRRLESCLSWRTISFTSPYARKYGKRSLVAAAGGTPPM